LPRVKEELSISNVIPLSEFLYNVINTALRPNKATLSSEDLGIQNFVEPTIILPSDNAEILARQPLLKWLRENREDDKNIAVLLAPAGMGKSTLALELFRYLRRSPRLHAIPLLATSEQWLNVTRDDFSLDDLWRLAISNWYPGALLGAQQVAACLATGALSAIFDGLDELCALLPSTFNMDETVEQLSNIVEDGRLLITSRRRFWDENTTPAVRSRVIEIDLQPFSRLQIDYYIDSRFKNEGDKRSRAHNILSLLKSRTTEPGSRNMTDEMVTGESEPLVHRSERIDNRPYVVMLATESADTASDDAAHRYGHLFSSDDPLEGLLLAFCLRERERQKMKVEPETQMRIFETLAAEFPPTFSAEDLRLVVNVTTGRDDERDTEQLQRHDLLMRRGVGFALRFQFIYEYLLARVVRAWLISPQLASGAEAALQACTTRPSSLIDRCATLIEETERNWANYVRIRWDDFLFNSRARSGFVQIVVRLCKGFCSNNKRESTVMLLGLLGDPNLSQFDRLSLIGPCHGLDFGGLTFRNCQFSDIEWVSCKFTHHTRFVHCTFSGTFRHLGCRGLHRAIIDPSCTLSPSAKAALQSLAGGTSSFDVDENEIREAISETLRRFRGGHNGFRVRVAEGIQRSVLASIPFGKELLESLEGYGVLSTLQSGGQRILKVSKTAEARIFLENGVLVGPIKTVMDDLKKILLR
jgi:hypothetical protein